MKIDLFFVIIFLFILEGSLFAKDVMNVTPVPVLEFSQGSKNDQVVTGRNAYGSDPTGPFVFVRDDGDFQIHDLYNKRTLVVSPTGTVKNIFALDFPVNLFKIGKYYFESRMSYVNSDFISTLLGRNEKSEILFEVQTPFLPVHERPKNMLFWRNVLYVSDNSGAIHSFYQPGLEAQKNRSTYRTPKETLQYLSDPHSDLGGLTLESENIFLVNGQVITQDFPSFWEYMKKRFPSITDIKIGSYTAAIFLPPNIGLQFLGYDLSENSYWATGTTVVATFSVKGEILNILWAKDYGETTSLPTVHPSGDVYFTGFKYKEIGFNGKQPIYEDQGMTISVVRNSWAPEAKKLWDSGARWAYLNDDKVNLRDKAGTEGKVLTQLYKESRVVVLETAPTSQTIGGLTAPWCRVRLPDNREGWIFGAFLDIQK